MKKRIREIFDESIDIKSQTLQKNVSVIETVAKAMLRTVNRKAKIIFFGNGGSAADSQHIAAEFIGRFQKERRSIGALALTTDTSILTALGNDYGYDTVFARQLEGLAKKGDLAVGISTSGNSSNVLAGIKMAKKLGLVTVCLTGNGGGKLKNVADHNIIVPSKKTARIQESHICVAHTLCELVEENFAK